jgi:uncharacterized membrane protein (UPF0127 family)
MRAFTFTILLCTFCLAMSCSGSRPSEASAESDSRLPTMLVTLPGGKAIRAEIATNAADQEHGLMFRTTLPPNRGMLFVFPQSGRYPFWMYHTLIPLDIVWMDASRKVVFVSANTPPCQSEKTQDCPNYGGGEVSQYVLEMAAGQAAANGLKPGDRLQF